MTQGKIKFIKIVYSIIFLLFPTLVLADNWAMGKLVNVGNTSGPYQAVTETTSISAVVGPVIRGVLGLIGVIFLVLMIYAGYNWMIARGEEEKVTKAKDTITRAIIGMIIVVGAYAIWTFIFDNLILK